MDAYRELLGLGTSHRPPNHYDLIGVNEFESDSAVIRNAANQRTIYLRSISNGPQEAEAQRLLNEVAEARNCLLDEGLKDDYDRTLRSKRKESPTPSAVSQPGFFIGGLTLILVLVAMAVFSGINASRRGGLPPVDAREVAGRVLSLGGNATATYAGSKSSLIADTDSIPTTEFQIQAIDLSNCRSVVDDDIKLIAGLPRLRALKLAGCDGITDAGFRHLEHLVSLRDLDVSETRFTDESSTCLRALSNLVTLRLSGTRIGDSATQNLRGLNELTQLELNRCDLSDAALNEITTLPRLQELDLQGTSVTHLVGPQLVSLKHLTLLRLPRTFTSEGLPGLATHPRLQHLDVSDSSIDDIRSLATMSSLRKLTLRCEQVGQPQIAQLRVERGDQLDFVFSNALTVNVAADTPWADSGLVVNAGTYYRLRANGEWTGSDGQSYGPSGINPQVSKGADRPPRCRILPFLRESVIQTYSSSLAKNDCFAHQARECSNSR